jgi:hypothetical protein
MSYEFATTLFTGFLPCNKKPLYYNILLVYEQKQLTSEQKASVLKGTYIHEHQNAGHSSYSI